MWYKRPETAVSRVHHHAGRRQGATLTLRLKKVIPANMRTLCREERGSNGGRKGKEDEGR